MKAVEYGKGNRDVILLLHGGGLSWWNFQEAAELLQQDFRVVLPVLDGHAGSDRDFTTIEANAATVIDYVERHCGGHVALLGGVSLGGQVAAEVLAQRPDICRAVVLESVSAIPMPMTEKLVGPMIATSYGLIQKPWFARWQFQALGIDGRWYEDYYWDTCAISKESMTAFLCANAAYEARRELGDTAAKVLVLVGEKETGQMHRSARKLQELIPDSVLEVLPGLGHGQYAINHGESFAKKLRELLRETGG